MTLPPLDAGARARPRRRASPALHVLVVGDVMLDHFIVGRVDAHLAGSAGAGRRSSSREHVRLGGAANVAHNIAALGGRASLVGIVGADAAAGALREQLAAPASAPTASSRTPRRPTTEKVRVVTERNQQVARDRLRDATRDVDGDVEAAIVDARSRARRASATALLVSDYLKGAITRARHRRARSRVARRARRSPLLVDPKIPHLACYAGATLVTPNHHEAEIATHLRIRTDDEARAGRARVPRRARSATRVLITRGEHGHVAVGPRRRRRDCRRSRAKWRTSPAPATRSSRRWRWRSPPARRWPKPPRSPTTPPASSSANSAPPRSASRSFCRRSSVEPFRDFFGN